MKRTFFSLGSIVFTAILLNCSGPAGISDYSKQHNSYTSLWRKVDSLDNLGLYKSAIPPVEGIMEKAFEENNPGQAVKSLKYRLRFAGILDERYEEKLWPLLSESVENADIPTKNVVAAFAAEHLWGFYQNNQWRLRQTRTSTTEKSDLLTWSKSDFVSTVAALYDTTFLQPARLQQIHWSAVAPVLQNDSVICTPEMTLFDLLADRASEFYLSYEVNTQPLQQLMPDPAQLLSDNNTFQNIKADKSPHAFWAQAIGLYQQRIAFHQSKNNEANLALLTVKRLQDFKKVLADQSSDSLYVAALESAKAEFTDPLAKGRISLALAEFYERRGDYRYDGNEDSRWNLAKALALCDEVLEVGDCPEDLCKPCTAIQSRINKMELNFVTEKIMPPNEPWRSLINYRNITECYYIVVPFDYEEYREIMNIKDRVEQVVKITSAVQLRDLPNRVSLDDEGDHRNHALEVAHEKLTKGFYLLIAAPTRVVGYEKTNVVFNPFWVSDIAWMHRLTDEHHNEFRFVHRKTGEALDDIEVKVYHQEYNVYQKQNDITPSGAFRTDESGLVTTDKDTRDRRFVLEVIGDTDSLWIDQSFYQSSHRSEPTANTRTHFFTDRKVYRPGQKVGFKGIAITYDGEQRKIKTNFTETVKLFDVNSQEVDQITLTTNEFGSYNGSFELPTSGITGIFRIESQGGSEYFSVEEYKRPTFSVEMLPVDSAYGLGDTVAAVGTAQNLAGFPLKNAEVRYRVTRALEQIFWRSYIWPQAQPEQEIAAGVVYTDESGNFELQFPAMATISPGQYQHYRFTVEVDVIDISGESHSADQMFRFGKISTILNAELPEVVLPEDLKQIKISATNLNGEPVSASGRLELFRLDMPEKHLRERLWGQPDQFQLDSLAFGKLFPDDVYRFSANLNEAGIEEKLFTTAFNTEDSASIQPEHDWQNGWYLLRLTSPDKNGEDVKFEHRFTYLAEDQPSEPLPEILWSYTDGGKKEPGDTVFLWLSGARNATVWLEVENAGKIKQTRVEVNNEVKKIPLPVLEEHRGNFGIHVSTIFNNRMYSQSHTVQVPYSNKALKVELKTIRNELEPGAEEEWTVFVSGPEGKVIQSEVLAGMYDASLDALGFGNQWSLNPFSTRYITRNWKNSGSFVPHGGWQYQYNWNNVEHFYPTEPCRLDFGGYSYHLFSGRMTMDASAVIEEEAMLESGENRLKDRAEASADKKQAKVEQIPLRSNFNETAFFIPDLQIQSDGTATFKFTLPESLTTWKWMFLAHGKGLETGTQEGTLVAKKPLMIIPNPPRFIRRGDIFQWTAQVVNKSEDALNVEVQLNFSDLSTEDDLTTVMLNADSVQRITLSPGESKAVQWQVKAPENEGFMKVQMTARSEGHTDGEVRALPVLSDRMLVTETLPVSMFGEGTKTFTFDHLVNSEEEEGLEHQRLTFEFSANPAWYAVQALPYLMEYPHECTEQIFSRLYANALAGHIVQSKPAIAEMFRRFASETPEALLSNLEKNESLKQIVLEETPWLLDAQSESAAKQRIALLFELDKMQAERQKSVQKLAEAQLPDGSWPWFKGMRPNRYITQYIAEGIGRLRQLGISGLDESQALSAKAIGFLDEEVVEFHKHKTELKEERISNLDIHFLYVRSFYPEIAKSKELEKTLDHIWKLAEEQWTALDLYTQAMLALSAHRHQNSEFSNRIIASLNERSLFHEERGRYWKYPSGVYWYSRPVETHTMMMALYQETNADVQWINEMKYWLLTQKKVQHWETTTATANACFALLLSGDDWLEMAEWPEIRIGEYSLQYKGESTSEKVRNVNPEPGTGHFKTSWTAGEISPEMGKIEIINHHEGPAWGAMYWQYFQNMDRVQASDSPLKLDRYYFVAVVNEGRTEYIPVAQHKPAPGDRIIVRLVLESELDMDYVHLHDRRASGTEPVDVKSGFRYNNNLGYYLSIKDAANHFFFDRLPKGKHVLEYELRANLSGDFVQGPGVIQCMYAPEYSGHTVGGRIQIE